MAFETDGTWVDAEFVEEEETKRSGAAFETDGTPLRFVPYYEHV
ncbi:MAG: hypothetical protein U9R15_01785 [Chloroflexota bacterium]|nr:hypothetical protein [Chloroflexota bacterium]